jgi:hypothetical protein
MRICKACKQEKEIDEFSWHGTRQRCRTCKVCSLKEQKQTLWLIMQVQEDSSEI